MGSGAVKSTMAFIFSHIIPGKLNVNMDFNHHVSRHDCQKLEKIFKIFETFLEPWLKYLTYTATEIYNHKNILLRTGMRLKGSRSRFLCPFKVFTQMAKTTEPLTCLERKSVLVNRKMLRVASNCARIWKITPLVDVSSAEKKVKSTLCVNQHRAKEAKMITIQSL